MKNLTLGFFALVVVHGGLEHRARHKATDQIRELFQNTGSVRVEVEPRGMLGLYASDFWSVDVYAKGLQAERMPFRVIPRGGWKGSIRHFRFHLSDFRLKGLPVERYDADIPFVTFDIGHAFWKGRTVLRGAGSGPGVVQVGAEGLRFFLLRKYQAILSDVEVWFQNRKIMLSGRVSLFGGPQPLIATGRLAPRAGRYLDIIEPEMRLSGQRLSVPLTNSILAQVNPILDTVSDLGLGGYFTITDVEIGDSFVKVYGNATVAADLAQTAPPQSEKQNDGNGK